jgi:alpha-1,6-mannosyltransferase
VLIVPGRRRSDRQTAQGRVITRYGPVVPFTGGYRAMLRRRSIAALLTELRPDRLEVSDRTTLRWTGRWAREHGVPAVMVSHESLTGLFSLPADVSGMSRWRSRLLSDMATSLADNLNRRSVRGYQRIVCTTRWAAAEFERIGAPNLTRIPLGVDLELFSPERYSEAAREQYAVPGQVLLAHCARLSVEKKPDRAITALAGLRAAGTDAVLVMAGDGPLRARLERAARRKGLPVRFTGFVADPKQLATLLASADVVIAPGPVETFGLAALEALACGTPVVVSAASALPEVVGDAGVAVSGEDFTAGVRALLARDPAARRAAARSRAEEFGWPASVAAFLAVHEALDTDSFRPLGQVEA